MHLEQPILVTGGSGFLGSHLCDRLLAEAANVICVDNFLSGARSNIELPTALGLSDNLWVIGENYEKLSLRFSVNSHFGNDESRKGAGVFASG